MSDTTRNETVATDDPPVRDDATGSETGSDTEGRAVTIGAATGADSDDTTDDTTDDRAEEKADDEAEDEAAHKAGADDEAVPDDKAEPDEAEPDEAEADEAEAEEAEAGERDDLTDDEPAGRSVAAVVALGAVAAVAVVALAVTALLYPGFLVNPGSPDDRASEITAALAARNGPALEAASCRTQDGRPLNPLAPDALALIRSAAPAGPPQLMLDTQARAPIDLTLSAEGQTQTLPADIVLGVTDGSWCMTGISQRE